jgi:hypothetical protein
MNWNCRCNLNKVTINGREVYVPPDEPIDDIIFSSTYNEIPMVFSPMQIDDEIDGPSHYGGKDNPYEAIKVIEAHDLGFHLGNAIKYILRAGKKEDEVKDLKKAKWYLERRIQQLENEWPEELDVSSGELAGIHTPWTSEDEEALSAPFVGTDNFSPAAQFTEAESKAIDEEKVNFDPETEPWAYEPFTYLDDQGLKSMVDDEPSPWKTIGNRLVEALIFVLVVVALTAALTFLADWLR